MRMGSSKIGKSRQSVKARKKAAQHYVPQLILRNFSFNKKEDQVWVFNKRTEKIYRSNVRNVASEKGFYDIVMDGEEFSVDPMLTQLEGYTASIVKRILKDKSLENISEDHRTVLSYFLASQCARTRQFRILQEDFFHSVEDAIRLIGGDPQTTIGYEPLPAGGTKEHAVRDLASAILKFAPFFHNKVWILLKTSQKDPFYISDNPIALQNQKDHGPLGNIGIGVRGIEIYFPLSKTLTLFLLCVETARKRQVGYAAYKRAESYAPGIHRRLLPQFLDFESSIQQTGTLLKGMESKKAVRVSHGNVLNINSLQVAYATELVFSCSQDFDLAKKVVKSDPKYREGPRSVRR